MAGMKPDIERMVFANLARLRSEMRAHGLDGLLISRIDHYHYATGLQTLDIKWYLHRQAAVITEKELVCLPPLPDEDAARSTGRFSVVRGLPISHGSWPTVLAAVLADLGLEKGAVGYDPSMPFPVIDGLTRLTRCELRDAGDLLARARAVKNGDEIALIRQALEVVEKVIELGFADVRPGLPESELSASIAGAMLRMGADGIGFPPIVSSGHNFSIPLRYATDKEIGEGEMVALCAAALRGGYYGELHRMSATTEPAGEAREIYQVVHQALLAGISAIRPGAPLHSLDEALRGAVRAAGFGRFEQKHVTGHGLGCNVLDYPLIGDPGRPDEGAFEPGMVVHVVSGIFKPGVCGCRVSEVVAVTPQGYELVSSLRHPFLRAP